MAEPVFVGIHGTVICLDRSNGQILWATELKGSDFVNILLDGDQVFASARGEMFCLDVYSGKIVWHNKLEGMGLGLATIATPGASSNPVPLSEKQRRDAAAAAGAAAAT